jgi:hypothetical protein
VAEGVLQSVLQRLHVQLCMEMLADESSDSIVEFQTLIASPARQHINSTEGNLTDKNKHLLLQLLLDASPIQDDWALSCPNIVIDLLVNLRSELPWASTSG